MSESRPESDTIPQGIALSPFNEDFRNDPYPILKQVQSATRVLHDKPLKRYLYTYHDDVRDILRDKDMWTDPRKGNPGTFMQMLFQLREDEEPSMLLMDEPGHRRLRSLVSASFTPSAVERWRERAREVVTRVLDDINSNEFDLITRFAAPVPTIIIAELLGIDTAMHDTFKSWSDDAVKVAFNPFASEDSKALGQAAGEKLDQFFDEEIDRRQQNPGSDIISDMLRAEEDGDRLSRDEMIRQCNLLLIAGNVTTTDLIGNGTRALLEHPDQLQKLRDDPSLIGQAIEEMLRYDSPVMNAGRIANRDIDIGGCPVHKGESLTVSLSIANRDPLIYPNPDSFDIEREDGHHQSFGGGRHLCLGAHLARVEAQEAILGLLDRYPNLRASEKGHVHHAIPAFRGMSEYWVTT